MGAVDTNGFSFDVPPGIGDASPFVPTVPYTPAPPPPDPVGTAYTAATTPQDFSGSNKTESAALAKRNFQNFTTQVESNSGGKTRITDTGEVEVWQDGASSKASADDIDSARTQWVREHGSTAGFDPDSVPGKTTGKGGYVPADPSNPLVQQARAAYDAYQLALTGITGGVGPDSTAAGGSTTSGKGSGSGTGGGTGGSSGASAVALTYAQIEAPKSKEITRQLDDFINRMDALYSAEDAEQAYKIKAQDANQAYAFRAQDQNMQTGQALQNGDLYLDDAFHADWGRPGGQLPDTRPENLSGIIRPSLPDYVSPDYRQNAAVGISGVQGFDNPLYDEWGNPMSPTSNYASGTRLADIRAFSTGTPYGQSAAQLNAANHPAFGQMPPIPVGALPFNNQTGPTAQPGQYNQNQYLPPEQRTYGTGDYVAEAVNQMVHNISTGQGAGAPAGYNGPSWAQYAGQGVGVPETIRTALSNYVASQVAAGSGAGYDDITYFMKSKPPTNQTTYGPSPDQSSADANYALNYANTALAYQKYYDSLNPQGSAPAASAHVASYGSSNQLGAGAAYANGAADTNAHPDYAGQLALQQAQFEHQKEVDKLSYDLQNKQFDSQASYQAAQIALQQAQVDLQKTNQEISATEWGKDYDQAVQKAQFDQQMTGKQFDLQQVAQEFNQNQAIQQLELQKKAQNLNDAQFQELLRQNGLDNVYRDKQAQLSIDQFVEQQKQNAFNNGLSQKQFEEKAAQDAAQLGISQQQLAEAIRKNQSDEAFQKQQADISNAFNEKQFAAQEADKQKQLQLEAGKLVAEEGANPKDALQKEYMARLYSQGDEPVGTGVDLFTGKTTGQKTLTQAMTEDAPIYQQAKNNPTGLFSQVPAQDPQTMTYALGTNYGFMNDGLSMLGDLPSRRYAGTEEVLWNPTNAPLAVVSHQDLLRAAGGRNPLKRSIEDKGAPLSAIAIRAIGS